MEYTQTVDYTYELGFFKRGERKTNALMIDLASGIISYMAQQGVRLIDSPHRDRMHEPGRIRTIKLGGNSDPVRGVVSYVETGSMIMTGRPPA